MTVKAHSGFVGSSGVQSHSAGDHFPILSYRVGDHAHVAAFQSVERVRTCPDAHRADLRRMKLAEQLTDRIHADRPTNGGTYWLGTDTPPNGGYIVSLELRESRFPDHGKTWPAVFVDILQKLEELDHPHWQGALVGVGWWFHGGELFVDVSTWILSRSDALRAARKGGQKAVWDIANNSDIFVD